MGKALSETEQVCMRNAEEGRRAPAREAEGKVNTTESETR